MTVRNALTGGNGRKAGSVQAAALPAAQKIEGTNKMRFSVVICTYNYAHLLPDALKSVAAQTLQDFELLIVDDGSTDNTAEIAEQFRPLFQDFRYVKKPHAGPADARNVGVQAAKGTHIAFLDGDDLWSPHYLTAMWESLSAHSEAGLALCEGITVRNENGMITEAALDRGLPTLCGPVNSPRDLFRVIQSVAPSGLVFSRDLYNRTGPFDVESFGWFSEDIDWVFRALIAGTFCLCVKRRLYLYRRHAGNLTNKANDSFRSWLKIYSQTLREARRDPQLDALARSVIRARSLRFLPTCSRRESQRLIQSGIVALGGDSGLRLHYVGTYLGLVSLLKILKRLRQSLRRSFRKPLAIDLGESPQAIFDALPK